MTTIIKVLPCPFCGRASDIFDDETLYPSGTGWKIEEGGFRSYHRHTNVPREQWCWSMHCPEVYGGCGAEMDADSKDEALAKWNRRPEVTTVTTEHPLVSAITAYLSSGGFFNPELAQHDRVRDLLIQCRDALMNK
tara:strand:+ start:236 stop:643 length:408 start_codon:yes stop_codon:yes gene_type:complete